MKQSLRKEYYKTDQKETELIKAIKLKDIEKLKSALLIPEELEVFKTRMGNVGNMQDKMIPFLVHTNDEQFIETALPILIKAGANINSYIDDFSLSSALHVAVNYKLKKTAKLLLDNDIIIANNSLKHYHPLLIAIENNDLKMLKVLMDNNILFKADELIKEEILYSLVHLENDSKIVDFVLNKVLNLNEIKEEKLINYIEHALVFGHIEILKSLTETLNLNNDTKFHNFIEKMIKASNIESNDTKNNNDNVPLSHIMKIKNKTKRLEIIKFLLDLGFNVNTVNEKNASMLITSSIDGDVELVKYLLSKGADTQIRQSSYGNDALNMALFYKHTDVVKELLKVWPDINKPSDVGMTPLITAIKTNNKQLVELILEKNPDLSIKNEGKSVMNYVDSDEIMMVLNNHSKYSHQNPTTSKKNKM